MNDKIKICFHVLNAYSLFDKETNFSYGGAELRASIFAKEIAKDNLYSVDFITFNHNQAAIQVIDNVNVIADSFYFDENLKENKNSIFVTILKKFEIIKAKFLAKDINDYLRTLSLKKSKAQFYVVFGISGLNKRVVEFCSNERKKLILFFASDEELNLDSPNFLAINTELIQYFITNSFLIFCQNQFQQTQLKHLFNKNGHLLLNPIEVNTQFIDRSEDPDKKIVWIGKSNDVKNPNLFISLVKLNPSKNFIMLCSVSDRDLHLKIKSENLLNLKFVENASVDEVDEILKSCHILISTSKKEGFPNVFLQAGKYSIPVISSEVNPNGYVTDFECGIITSNEVNRINESLQTIYDDKKLFKKLASNHYNYVKNFHSKEFVIEKFKSTLLEKIA